MNIWGLISFEAFKAQKEKMEKQAEEPQEPSRWEKREQQRRKEKEEKERQKRMELFQKIDEGFLRKHDDLKDNEFLKKKIGQNFLRLETQALEGLSEQEIDQIIEKNVDVWRVYESHKKEVKEMSQPRIEYEKGMKEVRGFSGSFDLDDEEIMEVYWSKAEMLKSKIEDEEKLEKTRKTLDGHF